MDMQPTEGRAVVRPLQEKEVSKGGMYLPEVARGDSLYAEVVAVGEGKRGPAGEFYAPAVKVGDTVLIRTSQQLEVHQEGDRCLLVEEKDLLAVVEDE